MQVTLHTDGVPPDVDELCSLPEASFFHSPRWFAALMAVSSTWRVGALVARDSEARIVGALPFVWRSRFGARRVYAGPWGTYGGAIARDVATVATLTQALRDLAASPRTLLVRVHDFAGVCTATLRGTPHWTSVDERCQVLDLPADPRQLFDSSFTSQNRNKIRKAEKNGIRVREASGAPALATYASLYEDSTTRWHVRRTLPAGLFGALANAGSAVQVWIAERDDTPVAALLNFRAGGQIMNWGNVSRREAWKHAPNNLLHWRAIEAACRDATGPRLYNFGSSAGLPGVEAFKSAFGARERVYPRLEYVTPWLGWARRARTS